MYPIVENVKILLVFLKFQTRNEMKFYFYFKLYTLSIRYSTAFLSKWNYNINACFIYVFILLFDSLLLNNTYHICTIFIIYAHIIINALISSTIVKYINMSMYITIFTMLQIFMYLKLLWFNLICDSCKQQNK